MSHSESIFIPISTKLSLHVKIEGEGYPLLCLSGFGCDHYNFLELKEDLKRDYQLIMLDNRGMGKSSEAVLDYSIENLVDDGLKVMRELGHERFGVIGISMGGFVAQTMAINHPSKVSILGLLCTQGNGDDFHNLPLVDENSLISFYKMEKTKAMNLAVRATVHPKLVETDPERFEEIVNLRINHPAKINQVLLQKKMVDGFFQSKLDYSKIKCSTFILTGEQDRFVSPENASILKSKISNSRLDVVSETDHLFFLERPRQVGALVKKSLDNFFENSYKELV